METFSLFDPRMIAAEPEMPAPANDNLRLSESWKTPAEVMQWIRMKKEELRRERAADASLLSCPKHRRIWTSIQAMEACARWHYERMR